VKSDAVPSTLPLNDHPNGATVLHTVISDPVASIAVGTLHFHEDGSSCGTAVPCEDRSNYATRVALAVGGARHSVFLSAGEADAVAASLHADAERARACSGLPTWQRSPAQAVAA
jgi:hypothetical protein